jgi:hypothetical protein
VCFHNDLRDAVLGLRWGCACRNDIETGGATIRAFGGRRSTAGELLVEMPSVHRKMLRGRRTGGSRHGAKRGEEIFVAIFNVHIVHSKVDSRHLSY